MKFFFLAVLLAFLAHGARAEDVRTQSKGIEPPTSLPSGLEEPTATQPWPVRLMVAPLRRGIFIRLPIVDTDPNRGVTFGFMPIWVIQEQGGDRIREIYAPSISYNPIFKAIPTFRYYYYPTPDADLSLRASLSMITDREAMAEYQDRNFLASEYQLALRAQYNTDGAKRFFGVGPDTKTTGESNYIEDIVQLKTMFGLPIVRDYGWLAKVSHHVAAVKISDGPINAVPDINRLYPGRAPFHRHQSSSVRLHLDYDTRDHDVTTSEGSLVGLFLETSQRAFGSEYVFQRYGVDVRKFQPWSKSARHVSAANVKVQQVVGEAPFWLLPQLGGKYVHRAYGEGRFVDRSMMTAQLEHRYTFYSVKMAGVTTNFEVAPFLGAGTVADSPGRFSKRYMRPVYGGAVRAVARPQVVGSIDFGIGQEGLTAFMDINYSF